MHSVAEKRRTGAPQPPLCRAASANNLHASPRRRKETLLPQIIRLATEGHSGQAIAEKVGLPKRTVNHWLRKLRREWIAKSAEDAAEMIAVGLARLTAIYREAMEAWRSSRTEMQVRVVERSNVTGENGRTKKKKSVCTESPRPNAAFLARATAAAIAILDQFEGRAALPRTEVADGGTLPLETLTENKLRNGGMHAAEETCPSDPLSCRSLPSIRLAKTSHPKERKPRFSPQFFTRNKESCPSAGEIVSAIHGGK